GRASTLRIRPGIQRFSLCLAADDPFVVIAPAVVARSDSDAAILFIPPLEIASSPPLLAMTAGAMTTKGSSAARHNENRWIPGLILSVLARPDRPKLS
ncbi:MAG TPA: hypothetical protein VL899_05550, partial [Alphaproteobacteria bacterium]|nr:hypothetical protein [Alphaproteobacteria bacterium]